MPIVELHILEGYTRGDKARLGAALTDAVRFIVPAPSDAITIMIHEMPAEDYYRGGMERSPAPARPNPGDLVQDYLKAMERREIDVAQAMLADGFTMNFPGVPPMSRLTEMIQWASTRYRFVAKTYEGVDAMQSADEHAVVYCRGTLSGEWLDGTPFDGIRFIDRFEVNDGSIRRQDVWNDIAEVKARL